MYRAGLLAVLLLATVAFAAADKWVSCTAGSSYTVDTTGTIYLSFYFGSIAPVFPDQDYVIYGDLVYSPAYSALWENPVEFKVTLHHYAPHQEWVITTYHCVYYVNGTVKGEGVYEVVEETPKRMETIITFTVPASAAKYSDSDKVEVSKPLKGSYCAAPPTEDTWPSCAPFTPEANTVTVKPPDWNALKVNGYSAGQTVTAYGVTAEIPDPWKYGIISEVGTFSYVVIDEKCRCGPDVSGAPVNSSVALYMVGMPLQWGKVEVQGAQTPLYVVKYVSSWKHPTTFCKPPACVVLGLDTYRMWWCEYPVYAFAAAVQSGVNMSESAWFDLGLSGMFLPLGSLMERTIHISWSTEVGFPVKWYNVYPRAVNSTTYYERLGENKKLVTMPGRTVKVAFAVDEHAKSIVLGAYSWPMPHLEGIEPVEKDRYDYVIWCIDKKDEMYQASVVARHWITPALYLYHSDLTGGRHPDLLHFIYGEPTAYYRGGGATVETGMIIVRTNRHYDNTTADAAGSHMLYYVSGKFPTDTMALFLGRPMPQTVGGTDTVSSWLLWLVPTAACRSVFCTSLSPEVLGPLPPLSGGKALPNTGYSIILMHIGKSGRHRVKVYVEDGYVISSGPPINVTRARNYKLIEIDKEWKPFEAVIVGPGWWVPYRQLNTCKTLPVNVSSIYATPDRPGPVKVVVEDNGRSSTYVYYVSDDVKYRITTRTPAPESITATPFNMTAYVTLDDVPYFHAVYGYGEGSRFSPPACLSTWYNSTFPASQLMFSGDFWGSLGLTMLPKPVNIEYVYTKPRLELVNPWRGLVKIKADGPVAGFAFYAQRNGTWVKIGEMSTKVGNEYRNCILVNASRLFPWDPILVLPLVEQELDAASGSTITIWRPETALLFKTWADVVGYPKGARSELAVVKIC